MNEQLVSWFEEILPDIKQTKDVRGTMLKFANKKNLAPALLEKLGHVYNTAKTVTYLDKCASEDKGRGESFDVLDIPKLLEAYTEKKAGDHSYLSDDFSSKSSGRFTDLFDGKITFNDLENLDAPEDYEEIKLASARRLDWQQTSVKFANVEQAEQLIFDSKEDNRKLASEVSNFIRDSYNETDFESLEQDAKHYFGDCVKSACDYVSDYMSGIGYTVKRASDSGESRLIADTSFLLKFAMIQHNLNNQENASSYIEDTQPKKKQASTEDHALELLGKRHGIDVKELDLLTGVGMPHDKAFTTAIKHKQQQDSEKLKADEKLEEDEPAGVYDSPQEGMDDSNIVEWLDRGKDIGGGLAKGVAGEVGGALQSSKRMLGLDKSLPEQISTAGETAKSLLEAVAPGRDTGQELIDRELDEAKYQTVLQDLIITDPILSEEDEDKVADLYNTIKSVAPEMSKDKNVVRVVLRSAVQYDGIAAPDLAQLVEAERSIQKSKWNTEVIDNQRYDKNPSSDRLST